MTKENVLIIEYWPSSHRVYFYVTKLLAMGPKRAHIIDNFGVSVYIPSIRVKVLSDYNMAKHLLNYGAEINGISLDDVFPSYFPHEIKTMVEINESIRKRNIYATKYIQKTKQIQDELINLMDYVPTK
jgi:hypothetical protein